MKPSEILDDARSILGDAIELRRRIHRHPERGLTLPRTQAAVLEALDGLGLDVRTGQRTTSVVARLRGALPGRTILLRADMDLVIAFSACPQDILPINGTAGKPTEAHFSIES